MPARLACALAVLANASGAHAEVAAPSVRLDDGFARVSEEPLKQSALLAIGEIVALNVALNAAAQVAGAGWADISLGTMHDNLTSWPVWDEDPYTINQLAHPWCGAMMFNAARSTGHGFWVSGVYTFGGSLLWEVLLENEPPSMNDQITTTFGGMLIGEALHRFGRGLLFSGQREPHLLRRAGATLLDPIGALNRAWWGDPWSRIVPPAMYAHLGVGAAKPLEVLGASDGPLQLHLQFVAEHGLLADASFVPRRPLDHFELRGSFDASEDDLDGTLYTRGLVLGAGFRAGGARVHGLGGVFAAYDFSNEERVRHSQLGVGPGGTAELALGPRGYLQGTLAGYLVPWGAAGGQSEEELVRRDYHRGPGLAAVAELKLGRGALGELRVTTRVYRIQATLVGDAADETVSKTTVAGRLQLARYHALGIEADYAHRHASGPELASRWTQLRAYYAITTDGLFSRPHR